MLTGSEKFSMTLHKVTPRYMIIFPGLGRLTGHTDKLIVGHQQLPVVLIKGPDSAKNTIDAGAFRPSTDAGNVHDAVALFRVKSSASGGVATCTRGPSDTGAEMLSYVIPVEDKPPPIVNKTHLQLNLEGGEEKPPPRNGTVNGLTPRENMAPTTIQNLINIEQGQGTLTNGAGTGIRKIIKSHGKAGGAAISTESSASSISSKTSEGGATPTGTDKLKPKLVQNGATKTTSLKRVSFGSSKGSMVETLIYESPLQEESEVATPTVEITPPFPQEGDLGSDSKKVRVSFFESERPHVVHSPEPGDVIFDILDAPNVMTSVSPTGIQTPQYQRQASADSGWDNPFRPDGDLSREADEIVGLIKEGKPITPTSANGALKTVDELDAVTSSQSKVLAASPTKGSNGTTANCEKSGVVEVQRTIVSPSGGGEVEPVVIKKKPKGKCCVIQ